MSNDLRLAIEICKFISGWHIPDDEVWRRFRIAVTKEELASLREWIKQDMKDNDLLRDSKVFYHALRGIPLVVEKRPLSPPIVSESLR